MMTDNFERRMHAERCARAARVATIRHVFFPDVLALHVLCARAGGSSKCSLGIMTTAQPPADPSLKDDERWTTGMRVELGGLQSAAHLNGRDAHVLGRHEGGRVAVELAQAGIAPVGSDYVVGGVEFFGQRASVLQRRPTLLVATPGRLLSLCGEQPASSRARHGDEQATGGGQPPPAVALGGVTTAFATYATSSDDASSSSSSDDGPSTSSSPTNDDFVGPVVDDYADEEADGAPRAAPLASALAAAVLFAF